MAYNETKLIHEITQSLYSSLDLEKSLHETLLLLKEYMPLDLVHVYTFDVGTNILSYLAEATEKTGVLIDEKINFTSRQISEITNVYPGEIVVLNSSESSALQVIHKHFIKKFDPKNFPMEKEFSVIIVGFDIVSPLVGGFGMVALGKNAFNDSHVRIMNLVKRPLIGAVLNLLHHREVERRNEELSKEKQRLEYSLKNIPENQIIGKSTGLKNVFQMITQVAALESPVLLFGETGTGKELAANEIHRQSQRSNDKMVKVNCGAIPESIMESELFGHEKGAFTGAATRKAGFFEQGDNGTIFLDEIGELSPSAQVKLLRVLQTMQFHRVGGSKPVKVNVRVIAATNRDLQKMVRENKFREDLWFRLNVFPIFIPPLRERKEDIKPLTEYFTQKKSREMNLGMCPEISEQSIKQLSQYSWPGNVRELENAIERSLIIGRGGNLSFDGIFYRKDSEHKEEKEIPQNFESLDEMTINHIHNALKLSNFKVEGPRGAAELLSLNPSTLRSKMKKLGIKLIKTTSL